MISNVILMSLFVVGVALAYEEDMIMHPLTKVFRRLPIFFRKPLYSCVTCMSSIWGYVAYCIIQSYEKSNVGVYLDYDIIILIPATAVTATYIYKKLD